MVRNVLIFCLLFFPVLVFSETAVKTFIDDSVAGEYQPLRGKIIITYDKGGKIDPKSFRLDGNLLEASFVNQSQQSAISIFNGKRDELYMVIETYEFIVPGKACGEYVLNPIEVTVDGKVYKSLPTVYNIVVGIESAALRLEAFVGSQSKLYPGQRTKFIYRILYKKEIELTQQNLPLLEAAGFRRVGDPLVEYARKSMYQVQEVVQEVEALEAGEFSFPPSFIEGFCFVTDFFGKRSYEQPKLRAVADSIIVHVDDFPLKGRPSNFNGAIGEYSFNVRLLSSPKVGVGDKLEIEVTVSGSGDFNTVKTPNLLKQKVFADQFHLTDLPAVGKVSGISKTFIIELRPLTATVKAIPAIQFSFFEPFTERYREICSDPIPVEVVSLDVPRAVLKGGDTLPLKEKETSTVTWDENITEVKPIAITGHVPPEMRRLSFIRYSPRLFWFIPLAVFGILAQLILKRYLKQKSSRRGASCSEDLWSQIWMCQHEPAKCLSLVEKAFIKRLHERGRISTSCHSLAQVPGMDAVQAILTDMEALVFSRGEEKELGPYLKKMETLFREMEG